MAGEEIKVHVQETVEVTAVLDRAEGCRSRVTPGLVLAHGAANDLRHPLLAAVAEYLAAKGTASTLRFNFPYAERGSSTRDPEHRLETTYRRAHDALLDDAVCPPGPVFLGGKSLGARIAAELVSRHHEGEGLLAAGLIFLGYPLHAPGRKERLLTEPLRRIDVPTLFFCGTRDPFCDGDLLAPVVAGLDHPGRVVIIEGGDHSLEPPSSSDRSADDLRRSVAQTVGDFILQTAGPLTEGRARP